MVVRHPYQLLPLAKPRAATARSTIAGSRRRALVTFLVLGIVVTSIVAWFAVYPLSPHTTQRRVPLDEKLAQSKYLIPVHAGNATTSSFYNTLERFVLGRIPQTLHGDLLASLAGHRPPMHSHLVSSWEGKPVEKGEPMVAYRNIFQTDKNPAGAASQEWERMNEVDGWKLDFYLDERADAWVSSVFAGDSEETHGVLWAWKYMQRGVLKADFLRYLLPLIKGGVYTDTDTLPIRPIMRWGKLDVETLNISATDGPDWDNMLAYDPQVVVGLEVDVHEYPDWDYDWPRAVGICQWTLGSAPHHPIFLEVVRRVVNGTEVVAATAAAEEREGSALPGEEDDQQPEEADTSSRWVSQSTKPLGVMEWTGPAVFTDSVLGYLLARYNVPWQRLRGLKRPLRIGEVLVLPITAFSPGGEPDFRDEGQSSPQCNLIHLSGNLTGGEGYAEREVAAGNESRAA